MYPYTDRQDEELIELCRRVAHICVSHDFKTLHSEMLKWYKKSGVRDPHVIAFQDTLFSFFLESDYHTDNTIDSSHL